MAGRLFDAHRLLYVMQWAAAHLNSHTLKKQTEFLLKSLSAREAVLDKLKWKF